MKTHTDMYMYQYINTYYISLLEYRCTMYVIILEGSMTCAKHYCFICSELTFEVVYIIHVLYIHVQILLKRYNKIIGFVFSWRSILWLQHTWTCTIHTCMCIISYQHFWGLQDHLYGCLWQKLIIIFITIMVCRAIPIIAFPQVPTTTM